jgi:hypothetical protein
MSIIMRHIKQQEVHPRSKEKKLEGTSPKVPTVVTPMSDINNQIDEGNHRTTG